MINTKSLSFSNDTSLTSRLPTIHTKNKKGRTAKLLLITVQAMKTVKRVYMWW